MYTLQALWTQARENLDCLTVILANRSYATLHGEMKNVGVVEPGRNARRMLDLEEPYLDWTHLARGMGVEAVSVDTVEAVSYTHLEVYKRQGHVTSVAPTLQQAQADAARVAAALGMQAPE